MQPNPDAALSGWGRATHPTRVALAAILLVTLWRLMLGAFDRTGLSTDEAQYWAWGQALSFGAYSKPPLIGWIIRVSTELFGSQVWAVRLPAAPMHAATAVVLLALGRRVADPALAAGAALAYLTTPAVALGSVLMTTDTPLLLAAALALLAQVELARTGQAGGRTTALALALGLAVGIGFLAKYAMAFALTGMVLAALLSPGWRPRTRDAALASAAALLVMAPHLAWLVQNRFVTFHHLAESSGMEGGALAPGEALRFLASQLAVMGPILFPAMLIAIARARRGTAAAGLAALAATPLVIVLGQALSGKALANWAVLYLLPGAILAMTPLAARPLLRHLSFAIGLLVTLALPLAMAAGPALRLPGDRPALARYLGHEALAAPILAAAEAAGVQTLVATDRDLLADLTWFARDRGLAVRALPPQGTAQNHWELAFPFRPAPGDGPALLVLREGAVQPCPAARPAIRLTAGDGFAAGDVILAIPIAPATCPALFGPPP
ncbi:MAG: glycosyltransferase family 39 protein [Rhodobacteraceae bacterium]|nr:glycosyltransferase family 39 protein [Paracoccaceae bacterium]